MQQNIIVREVDSLGGEVKVPTCFHHGAYLENKGKRAVGKVADTIAQ